MVDDLRTLELDHGLRPDFIFFTGDAAFGQIGSGTGESLVEQFAEAEQFFVRIRTAFSPALDRSSMFLVPGNHDIDRGAVLPALTDWLDRQTDLDPIIRQIQSNDRQWRTYMDRLDPYRAFLCTHGYDHLLADPDRLIYAVQREVHGKRIGIAGFNSVWSCGRNQEKGKLWVAGRWQLESLLPQLDDVDLRVALIHHPDGWFVEQEEPRLSRAIERDFHFHLHGHEHEEWVHHANGHTHIAAGACYDRSDRQNGYNFVQLNLRTGQGTVWLRQYDAHGGGWIPRIVHRKTDNDGRWPIATAPLSTHGRQISNPTAREQQEIKNAGATLSQVAIEDDAQINWTTVGRALLVSVTPEIPTTAQELVRTLVLTMGDYKSRFARLVIGCLQADDEKVRAKAARVIEELVLWTPDIVGPDVLINMARSNDSSLRISAVLCYHSLAALNPAAVPIEVLYTLATQDENWYVYTPAINALLRLARARPIVIDLLVLGLKSNQKNTRESAASAIETLAERDWDLVSEELLKLMARSKNEYVRTVGQRCAAIKQTHADDPPRDYPVF